MIIFYVSGGFVGYLWLLRISELLCLDIKKQMLAVVFHCWCVV
jgi:hypothetical protein